MDFGYCGGEGPACANFAQGFGSMMLILLMVFGGILTLFLVGRLLYLCFKFPDNLTQWDVKRMVRDTILDDELARASIKDIARQERHDGMDS